MKNLPSPTYNAQLTAGALLLPESREVARLLVNKVDEAGWRKAIQQENVLQKRTLSSAMRVAGLIRNRLSLLKPDVLTLVAEGDRETATQVLLVGAIKHSRLLGDFMLTVLKDAYRTYRKNLSRDDWATFLRECEQKSDDVSKWSMRTRRDLGNTVLRILAEASYLENTKSLRLTTPRILHTIRQYLKAEGEDYVLSCLDVTQ